MRVITGLGFKGNGVLESRKLSGWSVGVSDHCCILRPPKPLTAETLVKDVGVGGEH
jgi:hypothetical protein